jgi:hypothetical protein
MRASSLSNPEVIALLNRYFVPVYVSNEDYGKNGTAPPEEKAEKQRIYLEALRAKLSAGTVHAYVTDPDGHTIDSQHVATAYKPAKLIEMLQRSIDRLKTPEGKPLVEPRPQSRAPQADAGALVLHLVSRHVQKKGNDLVPTRTVLGQPSAANWGAYPQENWIVLTGDDVKQLLPGQKPSPGVSWELDRTTAAKILTYVYPSTENNDIGTNRIDEQSLRATVISVHNGIVRARLDGRLRMKHPFYHKDDDNFVDARLTGYMDFDPVKQEISTLRIVTTDATYGRTVFGVAIRDAKP